MMAVHSSGSMRSASIVEPTTSTNSTVTNLRSPDKCAARIFSARGAGVAAAICVRRCCSTAVLPSTGWPQVMQKRAAAGKPAPQLTHTRISFAPQLMQKVASAGLACWQLGQVCILFPS
jgi:hypothetical protein